MQVISSFRKKYPWIFKATIFTPILALFVASTALGEGDVNSLFFKIFYPYTFFVFAGYQMENDDVMAVVGFMGFFLYVLYGVVLTIAESRGRIKEACRIIIITHISAVLFCVFLL